MVNMMDDGWEAVVSNLQVKGARQLGNASVTNEMDRVARWLMINDKHAHSKQ